MQTERFGDYLLKTPCQYRSNVCSTNVASVNCNKQAWTERKVYLMSTHWLPKQCRWQAAPIQSYDTRYQQSTYDTASELCTSSVVAKNKPLDLRNGLNACVCDVDVIGQVKDSERHACQHTRRLHAHDCTCTCACLRQLLDSKSL